MNLGDELYNGGAGTSSWDHARLGQDDEVLIVRATTKLLDRMGGSEVTDDTVPTMLLGQWYATVLAWRSQVVLLVNELTLLPVLSRWRRHSPWRPGLAGRSPPC